MPENTISDGEAARLALLSQFPERTSVHLFNGAEVSISYRASTSSSVALDGALTGGLPTEAADRWSVAPLVGGAAPLPVVLLHGIGSASASWVMQLEALGEARTVMAWDAPGYGASTNVIPAEPLAHDYAERLAVWLDAMRVSQCIVVGHSLGAIMGSAFAASYPERVAGLLLLSPAGGYGKATAQVRATKRDARLAMVRTLGPVGMAETRSANMLSAHADEGALAWIRRSMSKVHLDGYSQATHLLAAADLLNDVSGYSGPLAVVAGADDTITPPAGSEAIASACGIDLHIVPDTGHAGYVEAPDLFSTLIGDFCRACERGTLCRG